VTFTCPWVGDAAEGPNSTGTLVPRTSPGVGGYSVYQPDPARFPSTDTSAQPAVTCTGW